MGARPSGTVTFLFTDIEGSTERWDAHREAMETALRRHDAMLRAAIEANGGFVFKTVGDAFCAAFPAAPRAFTAALEAQRAIAAADWEAIDGLQVRMALHAGTADERDGDYFGPPVNRVARLLSIAHGGQIICSEIASELARGEVEPEIAFLDLGRHRLKGIAEPESVRQVVATGLRQSFPALRSPGSQPNNLPLQATSFFGRTEEAVAIAPMLREHRIVTLVGPGGIGKTRLALHVGSEFLAEREDGVWLVEFAQIAEAAMVAGTIAATLGVQESPQRPILETLLTYLRSKRLILIFDNCEHVVAEASNVANAIVLSCAEVTILATSREALGVPGEHLYHTPSLDPSASAALFAARARAADSSFAMTDDSATVVADICRRLDGIALAVELAAARVKLLSLKGLSERLNDRLRILSGGSRTAMPRQKTLRALIDWSHDLLSDEERAVFRRLSVFSGSFSPEAAMTVCADESISEVDVLDLLASLAAKSLVQTELDGDDPAYRLLESTREYALEKLKASGEEAAFLRAHASAYADVARTLDEDWETTPDAIWSLRAGRVIENLRSAARWSLESRQDVALGRSIVASMRFVWFRFAPVEGLRWLMRARDAGGERSDRLEIARLDLAEAHLGMHLMEYERSIQAAGRAIGAFGELGDPRRVAESQLFMGASLGLLRRTAEGEEVLYRAIDAFQALNARRYVAAAFQYLALARLCADDVEGSRPFFAQALEIYRATPGAERPASRTAGLLAEAEFQSGDPGKALKLITEALASDRARDDKYAIVYDLCNSAAYLIALERIDEARSIAGEALSLALKTHEPWSITLAVQHIAAIVLRQDARLAAQLLGFVDGRIAEVSGRRDFTEQREYDFALALLRESLPADELAALLSDGSSWPAERAIAAASSVAVREGHP